MINQPLKRWKSKALVVGISSRNEEVGAGGIPLDKGESSFFIMKKEARKVLNN